MWGQKPFILSLARFSFYFLICALGLYTTEHAYILLSFNIIYEILFYFCVLPKWYKSTKAPFLEAMKPLSTKKKKNQKSFCISGI